jgi:hypothetical protein
MELELELRCHTEVAAASANRPEQVRILCRARHDLAAVGGDDLG